MSAEALGDAGLLELQELGHRVCQEGEARQHRNGIAKQDSSKDNTDRATISRSTPESIQLSSEIRDLSLKEHDRTETNLLRFCGSCVSSLLLPHQSLQKTHQIHHR